MLDFPMFIAIGSAIFFWGAARHEDSNPFLWAGLSLLLSVGGSLVFHFGLLVLVLLQVGLFIGIAVARVLFDKGAPD